MNISRESFVDLGLLDVIKNELIKIEYKTFNKEFLPEFLVYCTEEIGIYKEGEVKLPDEEGVFKNKFNLDYKLSKEYNMDEGEEPDLIDFGLRNEKQIIKVNKARMIDESVRVHVGMFLYKNEDKLVEHVKGMLEYGFMLLNYNGDTN